jgi:hypothetical protein
MLVLLLLESLSFDCYESFLRAFYLINSLILLSDLFFFVLFYGIVFGWL